MAIPARISLKGSRPMSNSTGNDIVYRNGRSHRTSRTRGGKRSSGTRYPEASEYVKNHASLTLSDRVIQKPVKPIVYCMRNRISKAPARDDRKKGRFRGFTFHFNPGKTASATSEAGPRIKTRNGLDEQA